MVAWGLMVGCLHQCHSNVYMYDHFDDDPWLYGTISTPPSYICTCTLVVYLATIGPTWENWLQERLSKSKCHIDLCPWHNTLFIAIWLWFELLIFIWEFCCVLSTHTRGTSDTCITVDTTIKIGRVNQTPDVNVNNNTRWIIYFTVVLHLPLFFVVITCCLFLTCLCRSPVQSMPHNSL